MNFDDLLKSPPPILVSLVVMALMGAVKASPIPNWIIPYIAYSIGAVGYCTLTAWTGTNAFLGLVIGAAATGFHQGIVQAKPDEPQLKGPTE